MMSRMVGGKSSWRWVFGTLIGLAIAIDVTAWYLRGEIDPSSVLSRALFGLVLALGLSASALLLVTISAIHREMRATEQVIGLAIAAGLGLSLTGWMIEGGFATSISGTENILEQARIGGAMLLNGLFASLTAAGLVFGLLLALVTGRPMEKDPLLELESTGDFGED